MLLLPTVLSACTQKSSQSTHEDAMKHTMIIRLIDLILDMSQDLSLPIEVSLHHQLSFCFALLLNLNFGNSSKNLHLIDKIRG